MRSLGSTLRANRKLIRLTLKEVSEKTKIDKSLISKFEKGERKPSKEQLISLCNTYEIAIEPLLIEWNSEQIVKKIINENATSKILILAEEKINYYQEQKLESKLRVAELFAGVGGFRLGLEKSNFKVVWSNQWEPLTKTQHASMVYEARFGEVNHSNEDIFKVPTSVIPEHDMLVGGFPCQDYSVATTLKNSKGLLGKKGVLWWSIHRILSEMPSKPKFLFFENVDRLLKSPSTQRGRDFAIMLRSLNDLGYAVEWRVINAADYGMPQRRKRVYFLGYLRNSKVFKEFKKVKHMNWVRNVGVLAKAFPISTDNQFNTFDIDKNLEEITNKFNNNGKRSLFKNSGVCWNGKVYTEETKAVYSGDCIVLKDILEDYEKVDDFFYINEQDFERWKYLKGAKKEERTSSTGYKYNYSEGAMTFPDSIDAASRTIITGEGGSSPSRFKHVIRTPYGLRRLTPLELERLNMFPDNHTELGNISPTKRAFFMGNALVVGVIEKIGKELSSRTVQQITNKQPVQSSFVEPVESVQF